MYGINQRVTVSSPAEGAKIFKAENHEKPPILYLELGLFLSIRFRENVGIISFLERNSFIFL